MTTALGRLVASFRAQDISRTGIDGMVHGMAQAVATGLQGQYMALTRGITGRLLHGVPSRDGIAEIEQIFYFIKDGGALRGEYLLRSPSYHFEGAGDPLVEPGTYRIILPGGAMNVYAKSSGRLIRTVPRRELTTFALPPQPWEGLRYTSETPKFDLYQTFARSLEVTIGDCDDHSIAIVTPMRMLGFQCAFRVYSVDGRSWGHVAALAGFPRGRPREWVTMDTTEDRAYPGWDPLKAMRTPDGRVMPHRTYLL